MTQQPSISSNLLCPKSGAPGPRVYDSRARTNEGVWRRRKCLRCGERFTTVEILESAKPLVEYDMERLASLRTKLADAIEFIDRLSSRVIAAHRERE